MKDIIVTLNEEGKKPILPDSFCLRACFVKDKKTLVLERLEKAVAMLKEAAEKSAKLFKWHWK